MASPIRPLPLESSRYRGLVRVFIPSKWRTRASLSSVFEMQRNARVQLHRGKNWGRRPLNAKKLDGLVVFGFGSKQLWRMFGIVVHIDTEHADVIVWRALWNRHSAYERIIEGFRYHAGRKDVDEARMEARGVVERDVEVVWVHAGGFEECRIRSLRVTAGETEDG